MTWSPLACGIVSGKYDGGIPPYSRASLKVSPARGLRRDGQSRGAGPGVSQGLGARGCTACTGAPCTPILP